MVLLWSALASGRVALMTGTLMAMPPVPPGAGWLTYVRCHDDIGWAITPEDAARVGEDAFLHRRFLADFYAGEFPGSFARGARFQPDPRTGEARTSGSCAALAGLESAPDEVAVDLAIRRVLLLHAVAFAHGGLPLIYMGDELGLLNDAGYLDDPHRRDDNRWMHRPPMDWEAAARRHDPTSVEGRLWSGLQRLIAARRRTRAIHVQGVTEPLWTGNDHIFGLCREQAGESLLVVANFTADPQPMSLQLVRERGFELTGAAAEPDGRELEASHDFVVLAPYQHLWLYRGVGR
jgi:amylosucrase